MPRKKKRKYGFPSIEEVINSLSGLDDLPSPPPVLPEQGADLATTEAFVEAIFRVYVAEHLGGKYPLTPNQHTVMVRAMAKVLISSMSRSLAQPLASYIDAILELFWMAFGDIGIALRSAFLLGYAYSECSKKKGE
jgi:hypothetical protein